MNAPIPTSVELTMQEVLAMYGQAMLQLAAKDKVIAMLSARIQELTPKEPEETKTGTEVSPNPSN
jgi:hypothetical protein